MSASGERIVGPASAVSPAVVGAAVGVIEFGSTVGGVSFANRRSVLSSAHDDNVSATTASAVPQNTIRRCHGLFPPRGLETCFALGNILRIIDASWTRN